MELIKRVFMLRENAGRGVEGDPCRWVMVFVNAETLEEICRYDAWEQDELRRKAAGII